MERSGSIIDRTTHGAVLMEVIVALALLAGASGVILGAMSSCARGLETMKIEAHAADLAVTTLSQVQMGLLAPSDDEPVRFAAPLEDFTWQVTAQRLETPGDEPPVELVQVIIRYQPPGGRTRYACRLAQRMDVRPQQLGALASSARLGSMQ